MSKPLRTVWFNVTDNISGPGLLIFARSAALKWAILACNAVQVFAIAHLLSADRYGLYAAMYTNALLAITIARTPLEMMFQRGAEFGPDGIQTEYAQHSLRQLAAASLCTGVLVFLGICITQNLLVTTSEYAFLTLAVVIGIASGVRRGTLIIQHRTDRVDLADLLIRPVVFVVLLWMAKSVGLADRHMLVLFGLSFIVSLLMPNMIALVRFRRITKFGPRSPTTDWARYTITTALGLIKNTDVVFITYMVGGSAVGSYYLLARMADLLSFGNNYANLRYTHVFSSAFRDRARSKATMILRRAMLVSGGIAILGATIALLGSKWLLPIVQAGLDRYQLVFVLVIAAQLISGVCGPNDAILSVLRPNRAIAIKAFVGVITIALLPVGVSQFGLVGAASVRLISIASWNIACFVDLRLIIRRSLNDPGRK